MDKQKQLLMIAAEIADCMLCRKGGAGKAVPGEGNPDASVVFIGEAPGKEEARTGRPFVSRSGKFLRLKIREIGLKDQDVFITSPVHYLPVRGTPSPDMIAHGRIHLLKQLEIIAPRLVVLLGNTACLALLERKVPLSIEHGKVVHYAGRSHFITFHPAYAVRFPDGMKKFCDDFSGLKRLIPGAG